MIIKEEKRSNNPIEPIRAGKLIEILKGVPADALVCFKDYSDNKKRTNEKEIIKDYIVQNQTYSNGIHVKQIILTNKHQKVMRSDENE